MTHATQRTHAAQRTQHSARNATKRMQRNETHAMQSTHHNATHSTQRTQRTQHNVAIAMRANAHKLSPPQSHALSQKYAYMDVPMFSVSATFFHAFTFIWTCLNSFSFILNRHGTRVFLNSIYQIDIRHAVPDAIVVNKYMNGRMPLVGSMDDCYWSLLGFRCVEIESILFLRIAIFLHLRSLALRISICPCVKTWVRLRNFFTQDYARALRCVACVIWKLTLFWNCSCYR